MPTTAIDLLERGNNLLLIKSYRHGTEISPAQRHIWRLLTTKYGSIEDAPGNITVLCVWGMGELTRREIVVFDWTGESGRQATTLDQLKTWLGRWWSDSKRPR